MYSLQEEKMYFCHEKEKTSKPAKAGDKIVEGLKKKLMFTGERMQVYIVEIEKGTTLPEHAHPEEQSGCILKGKFEVNVGGQKGILEPGHYYLLPGNLPHSGYVHEDTVLLDIYSPPQK
jgi:quercetin dioxygenase-like cupin family protein